MNSKWRRTTRTLWRKGSRGGLCLMLLFGLLSAAGGRLAYADATVTTWAELTSAFANAASGSIITLGAGIEQSSGSLSVPSGRSLILDLAGNRLAVHAGSGSTSAAVHVPVGATLTIRDSGVNGTLIADAASGYGAGIGGNYQETAGTIVIDNGNVTATGQSAAGIGGGSFGGSGGTTIINGGNVTALSTGGGAGIGSGIKNGSEGNAGAGGTIMINGGNVSATGTYGGAGIGGAYQSPGANVTITAGVVTVSGSGSGSAIGGTPFGSLYNSGQIQVAGGSQITIPADASVTNNGTISGAISGSEHMGGNNFTISFDWNGVPQSNPASIQIYTTSLAAAGKTLPSLSRAGYIWEGWYTAAEGGEQVTETSTITSSLTLYAHTISDPVPPSVQLMSSVGSGTKGPFMVTAKFSEAVSGFADGDVTVTNGTVGPISGSGDTYTFLVTPAIEGKVTVKVAAGVAMDAASNGNTAAVNLECAYDLTPPTVTLTAPAGSRISGPFTVTAKFSEAVNGFADGDVTVTNGTPGAIAGSGDTYTFLVTPAVEGTVTVRLASGIAEDAAGNGNAAATDLVLTYDHTPPTVTLTTASGIFTNEPFTVTAKFSEAVSGFANGDVTVTNGTAGAITGSGDTYAFLVTPTADGPVTVMLAADVAADAAGNGNAAATDMVLTYDHTPPTVTLTTTVGIFTNEPFTVTAKFSEAVSGFADGDVTVTNGTVGAITGSGDTYAFLVTPTADGPVTVKLAADVAADAAGNGNAAATDLALTYDHTPPTVTLTTASGIFTNEPFMVTAKFSEAVSGFADGDVTVTNGTVGAITGSGDMYALLVTPTADGPVTVQLAADVTADAAGNGNAAATDLSLTYDHTAPTVTLTTPAGIFTNEPFTVTAKFSEFVSGFADGDVTVTNGTVGAITGSGDTYALLVTPTADGPVTVQLAADVAADAASNGNAAATDLVLTYDHTVPTVTLTTTAGIFTNEPFTVTAKFSEAVSGLADGDVTVTNGTVGAITGSGDTYAFLVTPTADGPVTVKLAADVAADTAGNGNAAATDLSLTYDHTAPTVTLTTSAGIFTNEPFTVTAKFNEFVSGFADGDVTVTNGTVGAITGSGDTYAFLVTPTADGPVTVQLAADVAADAAGNGNSAATDLSLTYDHTSPTVTLTTPAGIFTNEPFTVTAKFSEEVSGFTDGDVTVANGTAGALAGSGDTFTFPITPTADGQVTVSVYGDAAVDAAGDGSVADVRPYSSNGNADNNRRNLHQ